MASGIHNLTIGDKVQGVYFGAEFTGTVWAFGLDSVHINLDSPIFVHHLARSIIAISSQAEEKGAATINKTRSPYDRAREIINQK